VAESDLVRFHKPERGERLLSQDEVDRVRELQLMDLASGGWTKADGSESRPLRIAADGPGGGME
jgi:hypothetical protein